MNGVIVPGEAVRGIAGKSYRMTYGEYSNIRNGIYNNSARSAGSVLNGLAANSASGVAGTVNALSSSLSGLFDQIGTVSAQNSALSAQYAREANEWAANQSAIAREFNAAEAQKNRDWQQLMSNTSHQREIADLKAAGLNPVLSAMGGNGASVTSGATASANVPSSHSGEVDTSVNASIVNLLSSVLAAQTQLQAADVSARTQQAVADKYTAMDRLIAEMSNATSRANAQLSAETSRYGIDVSSWTSMSVAEKQAAVNKYAAELSSAASKFGAYMSWDAATTIARNQLEWQSQHPNNMWQEINGILEGLGSSTRDASGSFADLLSGLISGSSSASGLNHTPGRPSSSRINR